MCIFGSLSHLVSGVSCFLERDTQKRGGDSDNMAQEFLIGLMAPPLTEPVIYELPPPLISPLTLPMVVIGSAVAVEVIVEKIRVKRIPKTKEEIANIKVLKLSDAYKVIDKVCNSAFEIAEIALRYGAAAYHSLQPHFPQWLDWTHAAADFREEVMNHLVVSLKDKMADEVLFQGNPRKRGVWKPTKQETGIRVGGGDTGFPADPFPIDLQIRKGKLHGLNPPRGIILPG